MSTQLHPKVVHLTPVLFGAAGAYGGAERYAWELSRAMAERVPVRLVGFRSASAVVPRQQCCGPLSVWALRNWLPGQRFASSPLSPGLLRHLLWADVIHCHQIHNLVADLATLLAACGRRPVFGTDHGGGGFSLRQGRGFSARLLVSQFSQSLLPPQARDRVIWGGVDTLRFQPPPSSAERNGHLLFVGRLLPHKGIDVLMRASAQARVPLMVVGLRGPGPGGAAYLQTLRQLASSLGGQVEFITDCEDAALVGHYQRALCLVLPSVNESEQGSHPAAELLGQTLLEAMACATPVIATSVGGMPEVVEAGVAGFLVPPGDVSALAAKIAWLRDHPGAARRFGGQARARVLAHFRWNTVVDRCLAAYGETPARPEAA